jgi:hypothetical protein
VCGQHQKQQQWNSWGCVAIHVIEAIIKQGISAGHLLAASAGVT